MTSSCGWVSYLAEAHAPRRTVRHRRSRRKIYRIADNFLSFYLGPLLRHRSEIERGQGETIMPALTRALDDHMGGRWEETFRDHLRRLAVAGALGSDVVAVGPWWQSKGENEIDAVVLAEPERTRVPVAVGEAKWARRVDARRIKHQLVKKAAALADDPSDVGQKHSTVGCWPNRPVRSPSGRSAVRSRHALRFA